MEVIDDTAQFIQQIGLLEENMRIVISISIAICIVFVVITLLTLKFFNGIFIKVRTAQQNGQDSLHTNSNQLSSNQIEQNQRHCDGADENPTCRSSARKHETNPQNVLTMPNNDCTISAVNSLSERIPLQNYQHFHHHYHHHHHFHLSSVPSHGNSHNHFNIFNSNTVNSGTVASLAKLPDTDNGNEIGNDDNVDPNNLIMNLRKGESNDYGSRATSTRRTNENISMTRVGNSNNIEARGHLQGHLHSHYPRYSQHIV